MSSMSKPVWDVPPETDDGTLYRYECYQPCAVHLLYVAFRFCHGFSIFHVQWLSPAWYQQNGSGFTVQIERQFWTGGDQCWSPCKLNTVTCSNKQESDISENDFIWFFVNLHSRNLFYRQTGCLVQGIDRVQHPSGFGTAMIQPPEKWKLEPSTRTVIWVVGKVAKVAIDRMLGFEIEPIASINTFCSIQKIVYCSNTKTCWVLSSSKLCFKSNSQRFLFGSTLHCSSASNTVPHLPCSSAIQTWMEMIETEFMNWTVLPFKSQLKIKGKRLVLLPWYLCRFPQF